MKICQIKWEIVGVDISCFLIDLEAKCFVMNILISCLLCISDSFDQIEIVFVVIHLYILHCK